MKTDLSIIPGVGVIIRSYLQELGYDCVESLKGQDPAKIYSNLCKKKGMTIDRCMLYVLREAVYYADHQIHDVNKLKWWNWKNEDYPPRK